ncbi:MAG: DUF2255 family protein [Candidatus Binataceae bacterium]|jgi:hypothetical protein
MTSWTREELEKVGEAEELGLASLRRDGSRRKPVTVWVIRVAAEVYVRSVNGRSSSWFRGAEVRHEGHVSVGGIEKEVIFADADSELNDAIDAAYRAKYRRYQARIVDSIVSPDARSATLRLLLR